MAAAGNLLVPLSRGVLASVLVIATAMCRRAIDDGVPRRPASPPVPAGPELAVRAGEPWKYGKLNGRYFLVVRAKSGNVASRCEVTSPKDARLCDRHRGWFSGPGTYAVEVTVQRDASETLIAVQQFQVDGTEIGIQADLAFMSDNIETPLRLAELHVMRFLPSIPGVSLETAWTPASDARPVYRLVNHSANALHGVGWFGNYFGYIEQRVAGNWLPLQRGGFCGTVDFGKPLAPGQVTTSTEGFFIGDAKEFTRGDYRYVLRYSTVSAQSGGIPSEIYDSGRTYAHSSDFHLAVAPFDIRGRLTSS